MPDFLEEKRREITARLSELKPLVDEYHRLESAASALQGLASNAVSAVRRGPGRPRGSRTGARKTTTARATTARATTARSTTTRGRTAGRRTTGRATTGRTTTGRTTTGRGTTARSTSGRGRAATRSTRGASSTATASAGATTTRRRPGRRKGSGTRAAQALSLVQGQPGITIPELAGKMGIKQNYLYRVLPGLQQENKVEKRGRGWHPKKK